MIFIHPKLDLVIEEMVTKVNYQMEAIRGFNYPYQALEEVVVNAFYHRDYLSYQSIMIEIEPELIRIISFSGIDRSIPQRVIEEGERFSSRYYRNKRLGEFLKELDLSEGKSTGIPTIQEELRNNGSSKWKNIFTDCGCIVCSISKGAVCGTYNSWNGEILDTLFFIYFDICALHVNHGKPFQYIKSPGSWARRTPEDKLAISRINLRVLTDFAVNAKS